MLERSPSRLPPDLHRLPASFFLSFFFFSLQRKHFQFLRSFLVTSMSLPYQHHRGLRGGGSWSGLSLWTCPCYSPTEQWKAALLPQPLTPGGAGVTRAQRSGLATMLFWLLRPRARSLGPCPLQPGSLVQDTAGQGWGSPDVPQGSPLSRTTGTAGSFPGVQWWESSAPTDAPTRERGRQRRSYQSALPASWRQGSEWWLSTRTPLRKPGNHDTHHRAWRTGGAPHARRTLQRKPREVGKEAQAP